MHAKMNSMLPTAMNSSLERAIFWFNRMIYGPDLSPIYLPQVQVLDLGLPQSVLDLATSS
jgi:hypothetical protein